MAQVLPDLDVQLYEAWIEVASSSSLYNGAVRTTVLGNLEFDRQTIERLRGELLDQARAGTLKFANWAEIAAAVRADIAANIGDVSNWTLSGLLWQAANETVIDVKLGVTDTVASVGGGAGVGFAFGLLLAGYVAWKFR